MELTLLTINTWKCDGDYYRRRAVLLTALAAAGAQVILCQECFRSADGRTDTLAYLSAGLGMAAYFLPGRRKERLLGGEKVDSFSGLGMLTSLPVRSEAAVDLPAVAADGDRKAQLLTLEPLPGCRLFIANIHLTHLQDDRLRQEQLSCLLQAMRDIDATPDIEFTPDIDAKPDIDTKPDIKSKPDTDTKPDIDAVQRNKADIRLIGGDWNAQQGLAVIQDAMKAVRALDCYRLGGGSVPRVSLLESTASGHPICVDHFFALPGSGETPYPCILRADIVLNKPDPVTGLYPSDHFGIRITLLIK